MQRTEESFSPNIEKGPRPGGPAGADRPALPGRQSWGWVAVYVA